MKGSSADKMETFGQTDSAVKNTNIDAHSVQDSLVGTDPVGSAVHVLEENDSGHCMDQTVCTAMKSLAVKSKHNLCSSALKNEEEYVAENITTRNKKSHVGRSDFIECQLSESLNICEVQPRKKREQSNAICETSSNSSYDSYSERDMQITETDVDYIMESNLSCVNRGSESTGVKIGQIDKQTDLIWNKVRAEDSEYITANNFNVYPHICGRKNYSTAHSSEINGSGSDSLGLYLGSYNNDKGKSWKVKKTRTDSTESVNSFVSETKSEPATMQRYQQQYKSGKFNNHFEKITVDNNLNETTMTLNSDTPESKENLGKCLMPKRRKSSDSVLSFAQSKPPLTIAHMLHSSSEDKWKCKRNVEYRSYIPDAKEYVQNLSSLGLSKNDNQNNHTSMTEKQACLSVMTDKKRPLEINVFYENINNTKRSKRRNRSSNDSVLNDPVCQTSNFKNVMQGSMTVVPPKQASSQLEEEADLICTQYSPTFNLDTHHTHHTDEHMESINNVENILSNQSPVQEYVGNVVDQKLIDKTNQKGNSVTSCIPAPTKCREKIGLCKKMSLRSQEVYYDDPVDINSKFNVEMTDKGHPQSREIIHSNNEVSSKAKKVADMNENFKAMNNTPNKFNQCKSICANLKITKSFKSRTPRKHAKLSRKKKISHFNNTIIPSGEKRMNKDRTMLSHRIQLCKHVLQLFSTSQKYLANTNIKDKKLKSSIPVVVVKKIMCVPNVVESGDDINYTDMRNSKKEKNVDVSQDCRLLTEIHRDEFSENDLPQGSKTMKANCYDDLPELIKGSTRSRRKKWNSDLEYVYSVPRKSHKFEQVPSPGIPILTREDCLHVSDNQEWTTNKMDSVTDNINNNTKGVDFVVSCNELGSKTTESSENIVEPGKENNILVKTEVMESSIKDEADETSSLNKSSKYLQLKDNTDVTGKKRRLSSQNKKDKKMKNTNMLKVVLKKPKLVIESNTSVSSTTSVSSPLRDRMGEIKSFLPLPFAEPRVVGATSSFNITAPSFLVAPCKSEQFPFSSANRSLGLLMPKGETNRPKGETNSEISEFATGSVDDVQKSITESPFASVDSKPAFISNTHQNSETKYENSKIPRPCRKRTTRVLNDLKTVLRSIKGKNHQEDRGNDGKMEASDSEVIAHRWNSNPKLKEGNNISANIGPLRRGRSLKVVEEKKINHNNDENVAPVVEKRTYNLDSKGTSFCLDFFSEIRNANLAGNSTAAKNKTVTFTYPTKTSPVFSNFKNKVKSDIVSKKAQQGGNVKRKRSRNIWSSNRRRKVKKPGNKQHNIKTRVKLVLNRVDRTLESPNYNITFKDKYQATVFLKPCIKRSSSPSISDRPAFPENTLGKKSELYVNTSLTASDNNFQPNVYSYAEDISSLSEHLAKNSLDDSTQKEWNEKAVADLSVEPEETITSKFLDISSDSEYESEHENPVVQLHIIDKTSSSCSSLASPRSTVNPFAPKSWSGDQFSHAESQGELGVMDKHDKARGKKFRKTRSKVPSNKDHHDGGAEADIESGDENSHYPEVFIARAETKNRKSILDDLAGSTTAVDSLSRKDSSDVKELSVDRSNSIESLGLVISEPYTLSGDNTFNTEENDNIENSLAILHNREDSNKVVDSKSEAIVASKDIISQNDAVASKDISQNAAVASKDLISQNDDQSNSSDYYKSGSDNTNNSESDENPSLDQRIFAYNCVVKTEAGFKCSLCASANKQTIEEDIIAALHHVVEMHCQCYLCNQSFFEVYALQGHIWSMHSEDKKLIRMTRQFSKFSGTEPCIPVPLLRHCMHEVTDVEKFACRICDKQHTCLTEVKSHVAKAHLKKARALSMLMSKQNKEKDKNKVKKKRLPSQIGRLPKRRRSSAKSGL